MSGRTAWVTYGAISEQEAKIVLSTLSAIVWLMGERIWSDAPPT